MKLRAYFDREFAPVFLADAAPATFEAYLGTIGVWERLTADPELEAIDVRTLAGFRQAAVARPGRQGRTASPATVNKDLRHLLHLLAKAGPAGPRNRDALGLLPSAPWIKPLRINRELPRDVPLEAIARVYAAAEAASAPRANGIAPGPYWQALIVYLYNLAARMGHARDQRWADVDLAGGTITLRAAGDKRHQTRRKPINETLARHLLRIRTAADRVFPMPVSKSWLYRQWARILDAAELVGAARIWPHDLKRAALTQAGAIADPFAVQLFGDHASLTTTTRHYTNPTARLGAIADRLPQPEGFGSTEGPQRRLFA